LGSAYSTSRPPICRGRALKVELRLLYSARRRFFTRASALPSRAAMVRTLMVFGTAVIGFARVCRRNAKL